MMKESSREIAIPFEEAMQLLTRLAAIQRDKLL